jgi:tRNA pseudouridine13 synthase
MFVHAYQSFLFNKILSERIKRDLPLNDPLIGDIVLPIDKNGLPNHNVWIVVNESNIAKIKRRTKEKKAFVSGLLYGSESRFAENEQGEIERRVVNEENLKPQDFIIPKIREISSKGTRRELLAPLNTLALEIGDDQVRLKFKLTKGCYATCLLREFMKTKMRNY